MPTLMDRPRNVGTTFTVPPGVEVSSSGSYHVFATAITDTESAPGWVPVGWWVHESNATERGPSRADIVAEFRRLADEWREATEGYSSMALMAAHDNYLAIIRIGWPAVPLILRDIRDGGGHWYKALRIITRENPVTPEMAGDVRRMDEAWLAWGRSLGLI